MRTLGLIFLAAATTAACGGSSSNTDAPTNHIDSATHDSKPIDGRAIDAPLTQMDGPPGTAPLTVYDTLNWCTITIAGGNQFSSGSKTVNVAPGTITLTATPLNSSFQLGDWHHTAGDSGAGDPGTITGTGSTAVSTTTVVVGTAAKCVWICCPFVGGSGCTPEAACP